MSVGKPTVRWWQHQWKGIAHGRPATLAKKDSVHSQGTKSTVTSRQKNRNLAGAIASALASPSDRCTNSCRLAQACTNSTGPSAGRKTCATARPRDATSIHLSSAQQTLWASTSCIARSRPRCYDVGGFDSCWRCREFGPVADQSPPCLRQGAFPEISYKITDLRDFHREYLKSRAFEVAGNSPLKLFSPLPEGEGIRSCKQ